MNENETYNPPPEFNDIPAEERNNQSAYNGVDPAPLSPNDENDNEPQYGLTFKWVNLLIGAAIVFWLSSGGNSFFTDDWSFYLSLAIVVIIHELGHVIAGRSFGCVIREMQVFFLPFISYRPKQIIEGNSWRNITWKLGVLPLGGATVFRSRKQDILDNVYGMETQSPEMVMTPANSPYIEDKPAWQRLLISAAGVLFNIATFLILYIAMPFLSEASSDFLWPLLSLSLILAILNSLPVYPLDGGNIVFALYEIIVGRKPSEGFTKVCGCIGFFIIVLFFWVFPDLLGNLLRGIFRSLF